MNKPASQDDQPQTRLELYISCRSLTDMDTFSKSDPYVVVQIQNNDKWLELGRTEIIQDDLNPNFTRTIIIDYFFEQKQTLKFTVYDYDDPKTSETIGSCQTSVAAIAGAKNQLLSLDLSQGKKKSGLLLVSAEPVALVNDRVLVTINASNVIDTRYGFWRTTSPFLRLYKQKQGSNQRLLVFETEFIKNTNSPQWRPISILAQKLSNGDHNMPIMIELWDHLIYGDHTLLGEAFISLQELRDGINTINILDKTKKIVGKLNFSKFMLIRIPSFMDFIAGGTQINLMVAIDFTGSNKDPTNKASLHYRNAQSTPNQYQQAIRSVCEILLNYDHDKEVPVFGFGCKVNLPNFEKNIVYHCFPINGDHQKPECHGLEGIMKAYDNILKNVQFSGPTYFNHIITEAMKLADACKGGQQYFVLLILTDGEIHDTQLTINSVVAAYNLPLSIIIIGVGDEEFKSMDQLDNDDGSMRDEKGQASQRDLVQFVPYNQYKGAPSQLAEAVLKELPEQLVEYMIITNQQPGEIKKVDLKNYLYPSFDE